MFSWFYISIVTTFLCFYVSTFPCFYVFTFLYFYISTFLHFYIHHTFVNGVITIIKDDEDQENYQENFDYWTGKTIKESPEGTCSQAPSLPSRDSRPPRDPKVPEKYRTSHPKTSLPTSCSRNCVRVEEGGLSVSIYRHLSNAGGGRSISCSHV